MDVLVPADDPTSIAVAALVAETVLVPAEAPVPVMIVPPDALIASASATPTDEPIVVAVVMYLKRFVTAVSMFAASPVAAPTPTAA